MKRVLYCVLPAVAALVLSAGCTPPTQWDHPNTDIVIDVRDSDGWSWFDANRPGGNMRENKVRIRYDEAWYNMVFLDPDTRAAERDLPDWDEKVRDPFRLQGYFENGIIRVRLLFGEFSVDTKDYRGEPFTIDWGDGTSSEVKFDLYASSKGKNKEPTIHRAIWVESGVGAGTRSDNLLVLSIVK